MGILIEEKIAAALIYHREFNPYTYDGSWWFFPGEFYSYTALIPGLDEYFDNGI